jgi:hypothetical protein
MLMRIHIATLIVVLAASVCSAATPQGSTKATAIPLKQRDPAKAVEEEMGWMMRLYHYTPILATRDAVAQSIRDLKAGKKSAPTHGDWGHATVDYNGHLLSHWWFPTPRGKRDAFFDTGTLINTPGEVARQERARAEYLGRMIPQLKVQ